MQGDDEVDVEIDAAEPRVSANSEPPPAVNEVPAAPLVGKTFRSKYVLRRLLARGGMGAVYEATGPGDRLCAVKMIVSDALRGISGRMRFLREARAVAAIESPYVVKLHEADSDVASGSPFLVMDLLNGRDVAQLIAERGALSPTAAVRIFLQAARGIAAAHACGIVHRDLKPANIFLHEAEDGTIQVKLCDFGVAKSVAAEEGALSLTSTGGMIGSPMYVSPEQARDAKSVDGRSDQWSLAIALHEVIAGVHPWSECSTLAAVVLAICTLPPPSLKDRAPWVDPQLAEVVDRALRRDVRERYPTIEDFIEALEPFNGGSERLVEADLVATSDALKHEARSQRQIRISEHTLVSGKDTPMGALMAVASRSPSPAAEPSPLDRADRTSEAVTRISVEEPRPARPLRALVIAIVAAAVGAGVLLSAVRDSRKQPGRPTDAVPPPTIAQSPAPNTGAVVTPPLDPVASPSAEVARVKILPPSAHVTVNGVPAKIVAGILELRGEPGESFVVALEANGMHAQATVAMLKGGRAQPAAIEVRQASSTNPSRVPRPAISMSAPIASTAPGRPNKKAPLDQIDPWPTPGTKPNSP